MDGPFLTNLTSTVNDCGWILQYTSISYRKHVTISNIPLYMGSLLKKAKDNGVKWRCADMEQRLDIVLKMHDLQMRHALWNSQ